MILSVDIRHHLGDMSLEVAFEAGAGVTALFGPSGAGKTSVIRAVAGLLRPDAGRIALGDQVFSDPATFVPPQKRGLGYVFQEGRLFPHMSVAQNLRYGGHVDEARIVDVLGLGPLMDRRPAALSGGESQRVALGRALMRGPELLLMDEPLAALDAPRKAEFLPYLERLRDETKVPILYLSHDIAEVARLASQIIVLESGKVVVAGPIEDVLSNPNAARFLGVQGAGAVLNAVVGRHLDDGLTEFDTPVGTILLPGRQGQVGDRLRLRIPAQDIILSRTRPSEISALNVLAVTVDEVTPGKGPGVAVSLSAGDGKLLARVTQRSASALDIQPGQQIFAIVKATAVAPSNVGAAHT